MQVLQPAVLNTLAALRINGAAMTNTNLNNQ